MTEDQSAVCITRQHQVATFSIRVQVKNKIGFQNKFVKIPNDTLYELELFKQEVPFKAKNSSQLSGNKLIIGYEGKAKDLKISVKKDKQTIQLFMNKIHFLNSANSFLLMIFNELLNKAQHTKAIIEKNYHY